MEQDDSAGEAVGDEDSASHTPVPIEPEPEVRSRAPSDPSQVPPFTHTRASGFWAAVVGGLLVLVILIVFILENGQRARVSFLGAHGHLPQGVALLLAAVIGGLFVVIAAVVRILELRRRAAHQGGGPQRRVKRRARSGSKTA
ncbi:MAG: lipopolysaccharide assembly protein LapA domain-containing protein [Acidimicrobiales bacterium]|jgi:uncharacterized integral membrane protein